MTASRIRHNNLAKLVQEHKGLAGLHRATGVSEKYLWQILHGTTSSTGTPRGLGNKAARQIEQALGLADGWMDVERPQDLPPEITQLVEAIQTSARAGALSAEQAKALYTLVPHPTENVG